MKREQGGEKRRETTFLQPDGERRILEQMAALNNELINAHRELARRNSDLLRINELKNQLLGIAAHDLRNPLSVIYTCSDFLLSDPNKLAPDQLRMLRAVKNSSEFMLALIEEMLTMARTESGKIELRMRRFNPARLVKHHVALNRQIAGRKKISIKLEIDPKLPEFEADPQKFEQIVENLISNAIKFSPRQSVVKVMLRREDDRLKLAVADQGPGIPEAEKEKLFLPFSRTSVKPTGGEKSTGLGLAIARNIVEAHHGRIWVESEAGKGATFFVTLPLAG